VLRRTPTWRSSKRLQRDRHTYFYKEGGSLPFTADVILLPPLYTACLMISVLIGLRTYYDSSNLEMVSRVRHILILSECQSAERIRRGVFSSGGAVLASSGSSNSEDEESEASGILARRAARRTATPDSS
jgi:hypothetical protein